MSTKPCLYCDGYGGYDCINNFLSKKPLKQDAKKSRISREFNNEVNEHRTETVL